MPACVLVIDNDPTVCKAVHEFFEKGKVEFLCVSNGAEAIDRISWHSFSAILLDLILPGTSGFEVVSHIRTHRPELLDRVVLMTAVPLHVIETQLPDLIDRVLVKPFLVSDLLHCIEGYVALNGM